MGCCLQNVGIAEVDQNNDVPFSSAPRFFMRELYTALSAELTNICDSSSRAHSEITPQCRLPNLFKCGRSPLYREAFSTCLNTKYTIKLVDGWSNLIDIFVRRRPYITSFCQSENMNTASVEVSSGSSRSYLWWNGIWMDLPTHCIFAGVRCSGMIKGYMTVSDEARTLCKCHCHLQNLSICASVFINYQFDDI